MSRTAPDDRVELERAFDQFSRTAESLRRQQEALRTQVDELERSSEEQRRQRLESLGRMAAELAHELRNPLGGIRLHAGLLGADLTDDPAAELVDRILVCVTRMEATITNMLEFAARKPARLGPTDLVGVLESAADFVRVTCQVQGVDLVTDLPADRVRVQGNAEALRQVALNLLGNAVQASPRGATVRLELTADPRSVALVCRDDGCGIAPEELVHVFDPFYSRFRGGTGLGLAIVHRIVEEHGGTVRLFSEVGSGTVATVRLPALEAAQ